MSLPKRHCLFLLLSCFILLAGCSSGLLGSTSACAYLKEADAEKILGEPVRLESQTDAPDESTCIYASTKEGSANSVQFTLQVFPSEEHVKSAEEIARSVKAKTATIEEASGIGDAAWLEKNNSSLTLHVRKGKKAFLISALGSTDRAPSLDEMKRVASVIANRV